MKTNIVKTLGVSLITFYFCLGGTIFPPVSQAGQLETYANPKPRFFSGHNTVGAALVEPLNVEEERSTLENPIEIIMGIARKKADPAYRDYAANYLVDIFIKKNQFESALDISKLLQPLQRAGLYLELVDRFKALGQPIQVEFLIRKATEETLRVEWSKSRVLLLMNLADHYLKGENQWRGLALLDQSVREAESVSEGWDIEVFAKLGTIFDRLGQSEQSQHFFKKAIASARTARFDNYGGHGKWGQIAHSLAHTGKYDEGKVVVRQEISPRLIIDALLGMAIGARLRGDYQTGISFLTEASIHALENIRVAESQDQKKFHYNDIREISMEYVEFGEYEKAVSLIELLPAPEARWIRPYLARKMQEKGENEKAAHLLLEEYAATKNTQFTHAGLLFVEAKFILNQEKEAIPVLGQVKVAAEEQAKINQSYEMITLYIGLAKWYFRAGDPTTGFSLLRVALDLAKNQPTDWAKAILCGEIAFILATETPDTSPERTIILRELVLEVDQLKDFGSYRPEMVLIEGPY